AVGCGIATAVVMGIQLIAGWAVLRHDPFYRAFGLQARHIDAPHRESLAGLLRLGVPMGLAIGIEVTGFTFMAFFISRLGATPVLAWVILFHIADAGQTLGSFTLRAYKLATVPVVIYATALWGVGLAGGYVLAFNVTGLTPVWLQGARGFWAASTGGLTLAAL